MKIISAGYFRQAFNTFIYDSKRVSQKWKQPGFEIHFSLFPYWKQGAGILQVNQNLEVKYVWQQEKENEPVFTN